MHHVGAGHERHAFHQSQNKKFVASATSEQPLESDPGAYHDNNPWKSVPDAFDAFYRFSRPHTVIGTVRFSSVIINLNAVFIDELNLVWVPIILFSNF